MNNKFETFFAIFSAILAVVMLNLMVWSASLPYASGVLVSVIFFLMAFMCAAMSGAMGWAVLSDVNWGKVHYMAQHHVAKMVAPVLKMTGYRFSKAWRGNWVVNHVEANMMADGFDVEPVKMV